MVIGFQLPLRITFLYFMQMHLTPPPHTW